MSPGTVPGSFQATRTTADPLAAGPPWGGIALRLGVFSRRIASKQTARRLKTMATTQIGRSEFARQVRSALASLYDAIALRSHPLAKTLGLDGGRSDGGCSRHGMKPETDEDERPRLNAAALCRSACFPRGPEE